MLLKFLSQILMMVGLGTMVYLFARTLPRISDLPPKNVFPEDHPFSRHLEKIDGWLKKTAEKYLRRSGIALLKLENFVNKKIGALKKETENSAPENSSIFSKEEKKEESANAS